MLDFFIIMKPELSLTAIIFILLFIKIGKGMANQILLPLIQLLLLINLALGFVFNEEGNLFGDSFQTNVGLIFQKGVLNLAILLISYLCRDWLIRHNHLAEFFMLLLSSQLGLFFMLSSGNWLIFYLALELSAIPAAALANFDLEKKASSEGAMKMILSSAFASGLFLFGISLLYGLSGTINFAEIPAMLSGTNLEKLVLVLLFSAFAFKLSVVPFHLWTADVYQGAPVPVAAYLSVVSKGAAAFVFITVLYRVLAPLQQSWYLLLVALSLATMIIGNLFALRQQNLKRFLAFSSISQVGFILLAMSSNDKAGAVAIVYFILIYVFSNLAAFGVVSLISEKTGAETIADYKGLYQSNPFLCWVMAISLFSLAGIPPTAGFFGKLFLITAGAAESSYWIIIVVALNLVLSLYYYLRVVRAMFMDKNDEPLQPATMHLSTRIAFIVCVVAILVLGLVGWVYDYIESLM